MKATSSPVLDHISSSLNRTNYEFDLDLVWKWYLQLLIRTSLVSLTFGLRRI